jgi:hypothetical protein
MDVHSDTLEISDRRVAGHTTRPRVTLEALKAKIAEETIIVHEDILTICVLRMQNGFYLVGTSAPASPENFSASIGADLAREDAIRQAWRYEGYLLRERLYEESAE